MTAAVRWADETWRRGMRGLRGPGDDVKSGGYRIGAVCGRRPLLGSPRGTVQLLQRTLVRASLKTFMAVTRSLFCGVSACPSEC